MMKLKNLMAIAIVFLIAISGMNCASASDGYENPRANQFYFDTTISYQIHYNVTYFDIDGKPLPDAYQIHASTMGDKSIDFREAVMAGARTVTLYADPSSCLYSGKNLYEGPVTPVYMNFWGWCAAGGHPHCKVSWRDEIGRERRNDVYF